jgi:hypothetical protein
VALVAVEIITPREQLTLVEAVAVAVRPVEVRLVVRES